MSFLNKNKYITSFLYNSENIFSNKCQFGFNQIIVTYVFLIHLLFSKSLLNMTYFANLIENYNFAINKLKYMNLKRYFVEFANYVTTKHAFNV